MHPALSVIVFTTASGAGYGMLFWLGLLAPLGLLPVGAGSASLRRWWGWDWSPSG